MGSPNADRAAWWLLSTAATSSSSDSTTFMPMPPPPPDGLTMMGKPSLVAAAIALEASVTAPLPWVTGTPFSAAS